MADDHLGSGNPRRDHDAVRNSGRREGTLARTADADCLAGLGAVAGTMLQASGWLFGVILRARRTYIDWQGVPSSVDLALVPPTTIRRHDAVFRNPLPKVYADWLGAPLRAHCHDHLSHEFSLQTVNHCLIPGSYQMDAIATVRTRSHAERRFSMLRFKRYDEALIAETRFGWEKLVALPIVDSDRAPVAMLLMNR